MKIVILDDSEGVGKEAASLVASVFKKGKFGLGLASGSTVIPLYKEFILLHKKGKISFKDTHSFNLDEYLGLKKNDKRTNRYFMNKNLFEEVDFKELNIHFPGDDDFESKIKEFKGLDLQILGLGRNGHIGFNEPGSSFDSGIRRVKLDSITRKDNSRFFDFVVDKVPKYAMTLGIKDIMKSKMIILLATGKHKAEIVAKMIEGEISEQVPASILQKHNNVVVFLDRAASICLKNDKL